MESWLGATLGQYQLAEELGRGGMAIVYKAYQPSLNRYVAIKVLPPQFSFDQGFVERFVREARGAAMLHHPNIVTIHDVSEQNGVYYFVMEYLPGKTLDDLLVDKPLSLQRTSLIIDQVADALDHAHSQNLIHRDIKPSNIIVDESRNDHAVLMDFGLVRAGQGGKITRTGVVIGTPEYMSPEQAQGWEDIDHRSDVYSLGVVLYHLLTGSVPFERSTPAAVLLAQIQYDPPSVSQINRSVPKSVEAVLLKAMAKDRDERYQSAGQLANDLRVAITGRMPSGLKLPTPSGQKLPPVAKKPSAPHIKGPTRMLPADGQPVVASAEKTGRKLPVAWIGLGVAVLAVILVGGALASMRLGPISSRVNGQPQALPTAPPLLTPTLLPPPSPKEPADGSVFLPKDTIVLTWDVLSGLTADDAYVVALDCGAGSPPPAQVKGATSYTVPPLLYNSLRAPYQCRWTVAAMRSTGVVFSAPSSAWHFAWSPPTATSTVRPTVTPVVAMPTSTATPTPRPTAPTRAPTPVRPTATTLACSGGRIWNGSECVCPPDKPEWFNGQCIEKGKDTGGGGGDNLPPPPPPR